MESKCSLVRLLVLHLLGLAGADLPDHIANQSAEDEESSAPLHRAERVVRVAEDGEECREDLGGEGGGGMRGGGGEE